MSNDAKPSARAIILGSGPDNPKAKETIASALDGFLYEEIETQRIDLGGRTIIAVLIAHDPAHVEAIRDEVEGASSTDGLDLALLEVDAVN